MLVCSMFTIKLKVHFAYIFLLYIQIQERFIKIQLVPISIDSYLK